MPKEHRIVSNRLYINLCCPTPTENQFYRPAGVAHEGKKKGERESGPKVQSNIVKICHRVASRKKHFVCKEYKDTNVCNLLFIVQHGYRRSHK